MVTAITFLVALMIYGVISLGLRLRRAYSELVSAHDFLEHLQQYLASKGNDEAAYTWLLQHAMEMQSDLGGMGIVDYKMPFASTMLRNVAIIPTLLQELRRGITFRLSGQPTPGAEEAAANLQEFLFMHIGQLESLHDRLRARLRNPVEWLREGGSTLLLLPLIPLYLFGLVSSSWLQRLADNWLLKLVSAIASILGLFFALRPPQ